MLFISITIAIRFSSRFFRSINNLIYASSAIGDGDLSTKVPEIKTDKDGNLGATIGRKSFSNEDLISNLKYFTEAVKKEKPDTIKGEFIKNMYISSTMGLSFKANTRI